MATLKKTRWFTTHYYEFGDKYFKVWGANDTAWYVEEMTVYGEFVNTVAMVDNMEDAEAFMKGAVMA